jgi:hypothetical protein
VADESVSLQLVDLLYAVPVADLAVRVSATHLHHVTGSGWTDIGVQLCAITFGWIGHHSNRSKLPAPLRTARTVGRQFLTLRFWQLVVEILIIAAYFALGTRSYLPAGAGIGHPSEMWKGAWLTVTFGLYLSWDLLDIWITKRALHKRQSYADRRDLENWLRRDYRRIVVTATFALLIGLLLWRVWAVNYHHGSVVAFDLCTIVVLYVYRAVQELALEGNLRQRGQRVAEAVRLRP